MATAEFALPDFAEPLDLEPYVRACSAEHCIKGLFFAAAQQSLQRRNIAAPMGRYTTFKEYPSVDYVRLVGGWVTAPGLSQRPRELVRAIGQDTLEAFRGTVVGKVILAAAGSTLSDLLGAAGRAYSVSIRPGTLVPRVTRGRATLELRNIPTFADAFHVGVFEGVVAGYGARGTVRMRRLSPVDVDLQVDWE